MFGFPVCRPHKGPGARAGERSLGRAQNDKFLYATAVGMSGGGYERRRVSRLLARGGRGRNGGMGAWHRFLYAFCRHRFFFVFFCRLVNCFYMRFYMLLCIYSRVVRDAAAWQPCGACAWTARLRWHLSVPPSELHLRERVDEHRVTIPAA